MYVISPQSVNITKKKEFLYRGIGDITLEEHEANVDDGLSEHEDHVLINCISGSSFEDDNDIDHQTLPAPAHLYTAREQRLMSKNGEIEWSPHPRNEPPRMPSDVKRMKLGPTQIVIT